MFVYINGKFFPKMKASVSVFDRRYLHAFGVFETLRSYNGYIFKCDEHITRLFQSAKAISLEIGKSPSFLKSAIYKTIKKNKLKDAYIRLSVSRGEGEIFLDPKLCKKIMIVIIAKKFQKYPQEFYDMGVSIVTVSIRKTFSGVSPQIKSTNFLGGVLAKILSKGGNYFEAVLLNLSGYITEGTVSNIFLVKNNCLLTPPVHCGILGGITRRTVIEIAKNLKIPVMEELLTLHDIYCADEVFLTNTSVEIMPVVAMDGRKIKDEKVGEITRLLSAKFKELVYF